MKLYLKKNAILSSKNSTHDNGFKREENNIISSITIANNFNFNK